MENEHQIPSEHEYGWESNVVQDEFLLGRSRTWSVPRYNVIIMWEKPQDSRTVWNLDVTSKTSSCWSSAIARTSHRLLKYSFSFEVMISVRSVNPRQYRLVHDLHHDCHQFSGNLGQQLEFAVSCFLFRDLRVFRVGRLKPRSWKGIGRGIGESSGC